MRRATIAGLAAAFLLAGASVARADHTHVRILPDGSCVILAESGNEKYQVLPDAVFTSNPNVDVEDPPENRRHPLHVLVHLGVPGEGGDIAVKGSAQDPCAATGNYVNG